MCAQSSAGFMCPAGSTRADAQSCPPGRYSFAGSATCSNCSMGYYGTGNSVSSTCNGPCPGGFFGNVTGMALQTCSGQWYVTVIQAGRPSVVHLYPSPAMPSLTLLLITHATVPLSACSVSPRASRRVDWGAHVSSFACDAIARTCAATVNLSTGAAVPLGTTVLRAPPTLPRCRARLACSVPVVRRYVLRVQLADSETPRR